MECLTATAVLEDELTATAVLDTAVIGVACLPATVRNSNSTFVEEIPSGGTEILNDTTYIFNLNGVPVASETVPSMTAHTFEINFV